MRTAQQIFDTVVAHLRQQNAKSMMAGKNYENATVCAYRGEHNKRCAVGTLIPDEIYSPSMESKTIHQLIRDSGGQYTIPYDLLSELKVHEELLNRLQAVHDVYPISDWESRLQTVADSFDLNFIPPQM